VAEQASPSRRARLGRSRRARRLAALVLALLIAGGVAIALAVTRDSPSAAPTAAAGTTHRVDSSTTATTTPQTDPVAKLAQTPPPRAISHHAPLRVWVGGDSLSGELGPSLGNLLGPTGVVKVTVDFKVGSGLHDSGLRNWPVEASDQMANYDPDVAIFMIGANDVSIVGGNVDSWLPQYQAKVDRVMDALVGGSRHRTVLWVGPPTLRDDSLDRGAKALALLMAHEAATRPDVVYVDAYSMFAGPDGGYDSHLDLSALAHNPRFAVKMSGQDLTHVLVRISDGVHFTDDGASWIAYQVALLLDRQWNIVGQSGGAAISVTVENGGGSIPGYQPRGNRYTPTSWHPSSSTETSSTSAGTSTTSAPETSTTHEPSTTAPPTTVGVTTTTHH
jgi:hypothetical protein